MEHTSTFILAYRKIPSFSTFQCGILHEKKQKQMGAAKPASLIYPRYANEL